MRRAIRFIVVASLAVFFIGCDSFIGPIGPPGPVGTAGPAGLAGPQGSEGPLGPSFILAIGSVDSDGTLIRAASVDGLAVASARTATGKYTVTISGTGAFSGVVGDQVVVGLTPLDAQEDNVLAARVNSINADTLEIGIAVVDVEGGAAGTLVDDIFYFQVFLIP